MKHSPRLSDIPAVFSGAALAAAALLALATSLPGCDPFSPAYQDLQCGPDESCPDGMLCSRGVCVPKASQVCGDGLIVGKEVCDDGNLIDGDGCNAACSAATCYVPVTHATVMSGLADQACSTLYLHSAVYAERFTLLRPTTLVGVGNLPPVLDGGGAGTVVTIDTGVTATLRRLAISNGRGAQGGGVLNRGTLTLDDVAVTDNTAAAEVPQGGGIANLGGAVTLSASTVARNHLVATGAPNPLAGAGIFSSGGTVRIDGGSKIEENDIKLANKASFIGRGGGIAAVDTALTILGASAVRGNVIDVDGGAGMGTAYGGGLHVTGGSLAISGGSLVEDNSARARGFGTSGDARGLAAGGGFHVTAATVAFDGAIVRNNKVAAESAASAFASAGGGHLQGVTLDIKGSTFSGNAVRAENPENAEFNTFATAAVGGLSLESSGGTISDTSISGNTVTTDSKSTNGTPYVYSSAGGAQIIGGPPRTVTLQRCSVDGNSAISLHAAGTASIGGLNTEVYTGSGVVLNVNIVASTISNNLAQAPTSASVGGLSASGGTGDTQLNINLVNSTISGNRADAPQGSSMIGGFKAETSTGQARVNVIFASSTIVGNRATGVTAFAGGLSLTKGISMANTTFRVRNTIIADNVATNAPDCTTNGVTVQSEGNNLLGVVGNCTLANPSNERTGATGLGPLADNGGPTMTHAPLAGSQAINNGAQFGCSDPIDVVNPLTADQRGLPRVAGGRCDIGAVEAQ